MALDRLNYGQLMQKALLRLVAEVLGRVAEDGLPGDHHFYITFDTTHPGVDIPAHLRGRFPDKMTIVLQEWFEDLALAGDRFSVTLSFDGIAQKLVVPLGAIQTFVDPSVEFGLRFDIRDGDESDPDGPSDPVDPGGGMKPDRATPERGDVVSLDRFRRH
ncbi:MAG: ClpXP protease specificity-enhancing factor SspB [Pseudomonadota bacterium]